MKLLSFDKDHALYPFTPQELKTLQFIVFAGYNAEMFFRYDFDLLNFLKKRKSYLALFYTTLSGIKLPSQGVFVPVVLLGLTREQQSVLRASIEVLKLKPAIYTALAIEKDDLPVRVAAIEERINRS